MAATRQRRLGLMRSAFQTQFGASTPPLIAESSLLGPYPRLRESYRQILLDHPPPVRTNLTAQIPSTSVLVRRKIAEIRAKSKQHRPICMKCGDAGHVAKNCRNKQLCFACNKLGHRATECRTNRSTFPQQHIKPPLFLLFHFTLSDSTSTFPF